MDFFTADLHLGHANILKYSRRMELMTPADRDTLLEIEASKSVERIRRWKPSPESVALMDEMLLANINHAVGKNDRLWILGDFAKPKKGGRGDACKRYRDAIACKDVRLVWGNHDLRHHVEKLFTHTYEAVRIYIHGDETWTEPELWATAEGRAKRDERAWAKEARILFLSHYAHVVWHHSDRGVYHLYGHSHGNLETWREEHMPGALALDSGVDCWKFRPVSFTDIDRILTEKKGRVRPHTVDHHGKSTWRGAD